MEATISADIIRSTSLPAEGMIFLQQQLREFTDFLNQSFHQLSLGENQYE